VDLVAWQYGGRVMAAERRKTQDVVKHEKCDVVCLYLTNVVANAAHQRRTFPRDAWCLRRITRHRTSALFPPAAKTLTHCAATRTLRTRLASHIRNDRRFVALSVLNAGLLGDAVLFSGVLVIA